MRIEKSLLCCVVFAFAFSGIAAADICQGEDPGQCIEDNWQGWEENHGQIQECVERLRAAGDEQPVGGCAVEHFCGMQGDDQAACEKAAMDYFDKNPAKHGEVEGWLQEAGE